MTTKAEMRTLMDRIMEVVNDWNDPNQRQAIQRLILAHYEIDPALAQERQGEASDG